MPNARVTQEVVEVAATPVANARLTQNAVEAAIQTPSNSRITQEAVEVLNALPSNARVTQDIVEALITTVPVAIIVTKTWIFPSDQQGWTWTGAGWTSSFDGTQTATADGSGSLKIDASLVIAGDSPGTWQLNGTWNSLLGIPEAANVISADASIKIQAFSTTTNGSLTKHIGPFTVNGTTVISTTTISGDFHLTWAGVLGSAIPLNQLGTDSVQLAMAMDASITGSPATATVDMWLDEISLTATYVYGVF